MKSKSKCQFSCGCKLNYYLNQSIVLPVQYPYPFSTSFCLSSLYRLPLGSEVQKSYFFIAIAPATVKLQYKALHTDLSSGSNTRRYHLADHRLSFGRSLHPKQINTSRCVQRETDLGIPTSRAHGHPWYIIMVKQRKMGLQDSNYSNCWMILLLSV